MRRRAAIGAVIALLTCCAATGAALWQDRGAPAERDPVTTDQAPPRTAISRGDLRFESWDVYIDAGEAPLAAYQFELRAPDGVVFVGIEGGEHPAYTEPPYYDPAAMMNERLVAASLSTASPDALPRGRTRVATVHLRIVGGAEAEPEASAQTAADADGQRIDATIEIVKGNGT